jgi:ATP-binding cassette subfamily F protein 3
MPGIIPPTWMQSSGNGIHNEQQIEIQELKSAAAHLRGIAKFRKGGKADGGDKFAVGFFGNRSKGTVGRAKNIEKRLERILTDEHVAKPRPSWQVRIDFNDSAPSGRNVLVLDNLSVGYQPPPLLEDISLTLRYGQRVTLIGPNGSGKTTLLRMITGQIAPLAGTFRIGANVKIGVMAQDQDTLIPTENALEAVQRIHGWNDTEARSFLSKFLFTGDAVFTSAELMSYGERARLMLAQLVAQGTNLLLLDEPINHMDIASRVRFEEALKEYEGTILAVVHDRYFIQNFATEIWEIRDKRIKVL